MGLAPWASKWPLSSADPSPLRLTSGDLLSDGHDGNIFRVNWDAIEQLRRPNELGDENLRPYYAALAATAQAGLEEAALAFVAGLRERTGETNVCLCGGVALNSVLNGKVAREVGLAGILVAGAVLLCSCVCVCVCVCFCVRRSSHGVASHYCTVVRLLRCLGCGGTRGEKICF